MLQLQHISKVYHTGDQEFHALKDISIRFRENEFVSILGQSGSGKTTLLNIIGGLDQYTSGDLLIQGKSTKQFKDRDWDSYRNHTIGFIFQSYNLIGHQTALSNVEIAMTLSGVSKAERKKRAIEVLERVGLKDHLYKKPSQMSGGQMQRIAIARALVNDPKVVLADEPTGALDSETSVQIMDLLKDIAKERLVIMVTHNPELAQKYSTRIVQVLDGNILSDSNPCEPTEETKQVDIQFTKTKMSFITALVLSFNNLLTKKGRTLLTAFAGSIGIIGIALILALSNGVSDYVKKVQEDTLVSLPLTISEQNQSNLLATSPDLSEKPYKDNHELGINTVLTNLLKKQIGKNDLASFKTYLEEHASKVESLTKDIRYRYNLQPFIYASDTSNGPKSILPSTLADEVETANQTMKGYLQNLNYWSELSSDSSMLESKYDVLEGRFPQDKSELVLIVDENNQISDLLLYSLRIKDPSELNDTKKLDELSSQTYQYSDFIGKTFKAVVNTKRFVKENNLWLNKIDNASYMKTQIENGLQLKIVGVLRQKDGTSSGVNAPSGGIAYTSALIDYTSEHIQNSDIVKEQEANQNLNVFTGKDFAKDPKPFSSENLTEEEKIQLAKMTPEEQAQYVQQYNDNSASTYEENLAKMGVINKSKPAAIELYTSSFQQKQDLKEFINAYNTAKKEAGEDDKVLAYSDDIQSIMSSITTLVGVVTTVLVGFVAISLIVSSIMISIITYISVLERTKEIGILRAMGASKKDIRRIFTAETAIEGLISGVLGITITFLATFPINAIVAKMTNVGNVAQLPIEVALILIGISIVLTMLAGLIPSRIAAKKDPVESLRSE
ncbi:ATP-binding cassette domain-containing protein [Streptococcus oralis]|jgi:ABC superfamily ATP binding cassette transporter, ABC protein|uniref:ABC transporter n=2 Tax=Streptococcus oralis TaxID=1303 RepID=A0A1X1J2R1_STROR|nr:ATP-binding cassette domain-containing protein [Streptococcus oralis]ORO79677.1 ABC transporter [Streptococcus oralis subsp. dentisani]QPT01789.1 ATP-binding cassette domain-containing protein [Streptococcus oralis]CAK1609299.1 ABC transporter [Streptococcus oralis subsp. dentisani]